MNQVEVEVPSNIALIKYWGMRDEVRTLPASTSLSMTLSRCVSRCQLEVLPEGEEDEILWRYGDGLTRPADASMRDGIRQHLLRLRLALGFYAPLRVSTGNTFPTGAGIASSASGFAALAQAMAHLSGQHGEPARLAELARLSGSGSAARSTLGGFVQWPGQANRPTSAPEQVVDAGHWPLRNFIVVIDAREKATSSREGHRRAATSPHYPMRLKQLPYRLAQLRQALHERDFDSFAEVVEREAIELHMIAMTSNPPIFYWRPASLAVFERVRQLRLDGLQVCATCDAGPNVHVLATARDSLQVEHALRTMAGNLRIIVDGTGTGPRLIDAR